LSLWFVKRIASESVEVMSASAVVPEVVHDGSVERIVDPEEVSMQRAVQSSLASGKTEQISRDAAMARELSSEHADMPRDLQPEVTMDGGYEKTL